MAWIYLTGWATRDGVIHFRDDVYGHDDKPARSPMRARRSHAARASGFVLQSADTRHPPHGVLSGQPVGRPGGQHAQINDRAW